ncbi:chitin-binding domain protein cbd-1-like [Hylaeus volcanicus]|uniref:chitin-binding domain protein cbd-1-like n=1 Tax=Hylaeus volcanicus TaxID=313075 RepID=UPI0023B87823|nr:chitin-binding domain protein cbd-1-like [Hylaeus volcanicus]
MGKKYEMDCNSDSYGNQLFFNAERQVCDYGWNVTPQNDLLEKCPPAGSSQTLLLAHECNCSKHYECHNGEAIGKTCQPGQMFDYILKKCVPAEKAMCKSGSSRMSPIEFEIDIPSIFECPPKGSHETKLIPHECICNVYFRCEDGNAVREECLPGQDFDYEKQKCGLQEDVNCRRPIGTTPTPTATPITSPKPDLECRIDCKFCTIRLPYSTECSSLYYECENGMRVVKKCSPGLEFNPITRMCDLSDFVNCPRVCTPETKSPHECVCNKYYECSKDGRYLIVRDCPEKLVFDRNRQVCDTPDRVMCPGQECFPGLRIPHECHCNEYYECAMNGLKQNLRKCEQGYEYDYERKVCDITSRAKCWRGHCVPDELLPHEYDCGKYYKCGPTGEKVVSQKCAEGYLFDCDLKTCVPQNRLGRCCVVIPPHSFNEEYIEFLEDIP